MAGMPKLPITLGAINILAHNPSRLADFWEHITGGSRHHNGEDIYLAPDGPAGFALFFHKYDQDIGTLPAERVHIDLTVPDGQREEITQHLIALGANKKWDVLDEHPHVRWTTLTDPEGNYLCIAEHPSTGA